MKAAIYTLGCKVNQYETQAIEKLLRERGHTVTDFSQDADAYIVNTCSVTAVSGQKSRQAVRRVQRDHPGAVVAVCGCYVQTNAAEARALGVDLLSGTGDRSGFIALLEQAVENRAKTAESPALEMLDNPLKRREFEPLPAGEYDFVVVDAQRKYNEGTPKIPP